MKKVTVSKYFDIQKAWVYILMNWSTSKQHSIAERHKVQKDDVIIISITVFYKQC